MGNAESSNEKAVEQLVLQIDSRTISELDESWNNLFSLPSSANDVWTAFSFQAVRQIRQKSPYNFTVMIRKVLMLDKLVSGV